MSIKLKIEVDSTWVFSHGDDEVLPVDYLKKTLENTFGEKLTVDDATFTELYVTINSDEINVESTVQSIKDDFVKNYGLLDDRMISVEAELCESEDKDVKKELDELLKELLDMDFEPENPPSDGAVATDVDEAEKEFEMSPDTESKPKGYKAMESINQLIGADEFKKLCREIYTIAPQIVENKTFEVFDNQVYIFSVNDGHGLTTYLEALGQLLSETGLKKIDTEYRFIDEIKIEVQTNQNPDPFSCARDDLRPSRRGDAEIVCIDIREWMNDVNTKIFKEFLMYAQRCLSDKVIVFRIPFVDKDIVNKIQDAINDVMSARVVSFPPFTDVEIKKYAASEAKRLGFKLSLNAWDGFNARIIEEKSDGRFYGLNTIKRVVRELIYAKQLENAKRGKNEKTVSKKEALSICKDKSSLDLTGYEMLDRLVAADALKEKIDEIVAQIEASKSNDKIQSPCIHMRFVGSPGTGKTTVARIIGKILKEKGVLRVGNFFEYAGRDFCGKYIGETAPKTAGICRDAYGSVLFIDEAYSLYKGPDNEKDYGREALDTLIAEMENHRSDMVIIMAGYTDEMETLMKGNAGLASRMPYVIEFPNFTREQLYDIFVSMLENQFEYEQDLLPCVKEYFMNLPDSVLLAKEFSNARFVRNLFERTWAKASMRCQLEKSKAIVITKSDFERSSNEKEFAKLMEKKPAKNKIGF